MSGSRESPGLFPFLSAAGLSWIQSEGVLKFGCKVAFRNKKKTHDGVQILIEEMIKNPKSLAVHVVTRKHL